MRNVVLGESSGRATKGGCATTRSNVSPPTGANMSPRRTSTFATSFIHALTRARATARSLMSVATTRSHSGASRMAAVPAPQPTSSALRTRLGG